MDPLNKVLIPNLFMLRYPPLSIAMSEYGETLMSILLMVLALILSGCFVNEYNSMMKRMGLMPGLYMLLCWVTNNKL